LQRNWLFKIDLYMNMTV